MDEREKAVLAVIDAWTIKGRAPEYHVKDAGETQEGMALAC